MKSKVIRLIIMMLCLVCTLAVVLTSCADNNEPDPNAPQDEFPEDDIPLSGLVLIHKNEAKFNIVVSSSAGGAATKAANDLLKKLNNLGITGAKVVTDKNASDVTDCEIIVGPNVKNRPSECVISDMSLGGEGYAVKVVGSRVIIAGGTSELTRERLNKFVSEKMGITDSTTSKRNVAIDPSINIYVPTKYRLDKITVAGTDIANAVIVCDQNQSVVYPSATDSIKNLLYKNAGYWLNVVDEKDAISLAGKNQIKIKIVDDAGEDGFRIYVDGKNLVVECSLPVLFGQTFEEFVTAEIATARGILDFPADYTWTKHIATVKYTDFGAKGDGVANDFWAIYRCHEQINITGQKLVFGAPSGDFKNKYYIGQTWETVEQEIDGVLQNVNVTRTVQIKTDVDFGDATFIIDDNIPEIHDVESRRQASIFSIARDGRTRTYYKEGDTSNLISVLTDNPKLTANTASIPWLAPVLTDSDKFMLRIINENHKDFIRYGANENEGGSRNDVIVVDNNGNVASDTPIIFDFNDITSIQIIPLNDSPITVEGGKFITKPNQDSNRIRQYDGYKRGIEIVRPNATLKGIDHEVIGEGDYGFPYGGFVAIRFSYNSTLSDSKLSGRRKYKAADGVDMGSYDLTINNSSNIYIKNITQYRDIKNQTYWGISATNGCKNLTFDNVVISRIDSHAGLWNIDVKNSIIGFAINLVGGGTANFTNVKKRTGDRFITLRDDYGSTWNGTINIKNCHLNGLKERSYKDYNGESWGKDSAWNKEFVDYVVIINCGLSRHNDNDTERAKYLAWNFGYTIYMPQTVNVDNFSAGADDPNTDSNEKSDHIFSRLYIFEDLRNDVFTKYKIVKTMTKKNMSGRTLMVCPTTSGNYSNLGGKTVTAK